MERPLRRLAVHAVGLAAFLGPVASHAAPEPARRIAVVLPDGWPSAGLERWVSFARREGIEIRIARDGDPAAGGWEQVRLAATPVGEAFRRRLARFPVEVEPGGFLFDGRAYRAESDALLLTEPERGSETLVLGNSRNAAMLLLRRAFRGSGLVPGAFRAISGELSKEGRFVQVRGALTIDRASERDRLAEREQFHASLAAERRAGILWRFPAGARGAFEKWSAVAGRFLVRARPRPPSRTVVLYPDPATKALYTGSSRPADLWWEGERARVDVDASAPLQPDLVSPVLAAAAIGAAEPRLRERGSLLLAAGARAHGSWWGRAVPSFAGFLERAGVHPSVAEALGSGRDDLSPIAAVGAAASWLDAGFREGGDAALARLFAAEDGELVETLERWRRRAAAAPVARPRRRALPAGFLRGVSYAMANSVEGSYASPRSRETLTRLAGMAVNSISVIPYGYSPTERSPGLAFVHRSPRGETDEGTVRAVSDARSLGLTAMVKPQVWIGGGAFAGAIAMESREQWAAWFRAYRRFAVHHAIVAEAAGASLFCVGTELSATESRAGEWRGVIAAVREATGATLLYATNWAAGAPKVEFWDALDAIGVDFYDPLSPDPNATDAALTAGARRAAGPLARLSAATGKPVIFAEAGYPAASSAWTTPHDENTGRPIAPQDAGRAVRAVFAAFSSERWWKGVYWWKAFSDGRDARPSDRGFNFLGRPAGEAIAAGFRRLVSAGEATR